MELGHKTLYDILFTQFVQVWNIFGFSDWKKDTYLSNYSIVRVIYLRKSGNHITSMYQVGKLISELDYHDQLQAYLARHIKNHQTFITFILAPWQTYYIILECIDVLRGYTIMLNHSLIGDLSKLCFNFLNFEQLIE